MNPGYFTKSIETTLNEMAASGQIRTEGDGRKKIVRLRREDWRFLVTWPGERNFPCWAHWPSALHFALRTIELLRNTEEQDVSENLRAIQWRGFLDEVAPAMRDSRLNEHLSAHSGLKGAQLIDAILNDAEKLGDLLDRDFAYSHSFTE